MDACGGRVKKKKQEQNRGCGGVEESTRRKKKTWLMRGWDGVGCSWMLILGTHKRERCEHC